MLDVTQHTSLSDGAVIIMQMVQNHPLNNLDVEQYKYWRFQVRYNFYEGTNA